MTKMMTKSAKPSEIDRKWVLIDAKDQVLGRLASAVAVKIRGKHLPIFTPHADTGDFVVVINASRVRLTGKKWDDKIYYHHTGHIGGIKSISARKLVQKRPEALIQKAVRGMLPKNRLGDRLYKKLKVYPGADHPHQAQKPEPIGI